MILEIIKEGKIVPSEVTVKLIQKALSAKDNHKFLIDGFPHTEENRVAYERIVSRPCLVQFIVFKYFIPNLHIRFLFGAGWSRAKPCAIL
jgi:adenylate kinase family enzyme